MFFKSELSKAELRTGMEAAIKTAIVPDLRVMGFKGSLPHFRRLMPDRIDLLTFGFDKDGGGFYIEIAQCPPNGFTHSWGKHVEPSKVTAWDIFPKQRPRLTSGMKPNEDKWFRFDQGQFGKCVSEVKMLIPEAEAWFINLKGMPAS